MITCPWCGTQYLAFQSNCMNCGGPLQAVVENLPSTASTEDTPSPPPAPRPIPQRYVWRLLSTDGWWIVSLVFGLLGIIFSLVGGGLILGVITAFVGFPLFLAGLGFLAGGVLVFNWRHQNARKVVDVLREGETTRGQITEILENYSVMINGRHPWEIRYQFQANGQDHEGEVVTLNQPEPGLQAGRGVCVLYLPAAPKWNSIYPHP
jgi:hypothetical protein